MTRMTFVGLEDRPLRYLEHEYNAARTNERAVEVPIALDWISQRSGAGLEVGNVLRHYTPDATWPVVDRYEEALDVENIDVLDITYRCDWIVTISTLEHVGWDEDPWHPEIPGPDRSTPEKALEALNHLRSLLVPGGRLLVTVPTGHNTQLDAAIVDGRAGTPLRSVLMVRTDAPTERRPGTWERQPFRLVPYNHAAWSAGAVWVAEFGPA